MSYKLLLNPKYPDFKKHLQNIKNIFNISNESIHKARNELKIVELGGIKCVVKSFKVPHFINRIAYTFLRDGKAKKSYLNALKLTNLHINTPEPIGIIEFFDMGLLSESYFISVYEPYDFTIREVFHHKVENTEQILKEFAHFSYALHKKGVWHVDYSLGNILITKQEDNYRFSLVDINRMEFKTIEGYEGLKNFNKFWAKDKNDLVIIAKEYAKLASLKEEESVKTIMDEAKKLEDKINLKRKIKSISKP
ncbi:lipopolysaccharide kinase InaA family protein [Sulfurimonas sp. HSL-1716]|uniref:lipopolysaccharide kinase InaA family protein n=1 Tax=Hydrocurvibacter sulfurireducens TaxID=3131937 RepID=UPI0031F89511